MSRHFSFLRSTAGHKRLTYEFGGFEASVKKIYFAEPIISEIQFNCLVEGFSSFMTKNGLINYLTPVFSDSSGKLDKTAMNFACLMYCKLAGYYAFKGEIYSKPRRNRMVGYSTLNSLNLSLIRHAQEAYVSWLYGSDVIF